ncbi:MAG TPA: hypothetical protein VMB71_01635 [Acetobacteraceae bacterium]|nr:hypothetical protein [Acetobacteraceae bacterium]
MHRKEDSSFSEEKEAKRLLPVAPLAVGDRATRNPRAKVFCFFFSKKKTFP